MADYIRDIVAMRAVRQGDTANELSTYSIRYYHHNGAAERFLSAQFSEFISRFADYPIRGTFTYFGAYPGGSTLEGHVDREQCEFVLDIAVDA